jgi:hypothetical protein
METQFYGAAILAQMHAHARVAALTASQELLEQANETVPRATGELMASGRAGIEEGSIATGEVSYDAPHAIQQHEDTSLTHPDAHNPASNSAGRARWLELAAMENAENLSEIYVATYVAGAAVTR